MPKYYCDYCDTYLTHDAPRVRKTHCAGRKHLDNVRIYYQTFVNDQMQAAINAIAEMHKNAPPVQYPYPSPWPQQNPHGAAVPPYFPYGQNPGMPAQPPQCLPPLGPNGPPPPFGNPAFLTANGPVARPPPPQGFPPYPMPGFPGLMPPNGGPNGVPPMSMPGYPSRPPFKGN